MAGGGRGGHRAGDRRHRDQRHRATRSSSPGRRPRPGSTACWWSPRTTTDPPRPGSARTSGPWPRPPTLPVMLYDIPVRTGRRIAPDTMVRLAARGAQHRGGEGRHRRPGRRRPPAGRGVPTGFELYSGDDALTLPLLAVGAVGRGQRGLALGRPRDVRDGRRLPQGRRGGRPRMPTPGWSSPTTSRSTDEFPNPLPAKAACRALGLPVGPVPGRPWAPPRRSSTARPGACSVGLACRLR